MSAELCCVCGRPPHLADDPECVPATAPIAERLAFLIAENQRLRALLAAQAPAAEPPKPEPIRCPEKLKPGGCQLHNLHCGWPACNKEKP